MKRAGLIDKVILGTATSSEIEALQELIAFDDDARCDFHDVNYVVVNSTETPETVHDERYYDGLRRIKFSIGKIKRRRRVMGWVHSLLLTLIGVVCIAFCLIFWISKPAVISFYYADKGFSKVHRTVLPDGSTVVLRGNSSLRFYHIPFVRVLQITGDAYVEVYPNSLKPFYVLNGLGTIRSTGAAFFTRIYPGEFAQVFVTQGTTDVRYHDQHFFIATGETITLLQSATQGTSTQQDPNFNAWYTGKLIFKNTRAEDIFFALETEFNVLIEIRDFDVSGRCFSGTFYKPDCVDEILGVLCTPFGFDYHIEEPGIYVLTRR